jgi:hypothetical protein
MVRDAGCALVQQHDRRIDHPHGRLVPGRQCIYTGSGSICLKCFKRRAYFQALAQPWHSRGRRNIYFETVPGGSEAA